MKSLKNVVPAYQLIIVDGNFCAYKYKCMPFLKFANSKGVKTGYIYGLLRFVGILKREFANIRTQIIFCWDAQEEKLRKSMSSEYKSNRDHSDDEPMYEQIEVVSEFINLSGYQSVGSICGYEADDVGFTIVRLAVKKGLERILLVSGDKDWEQMVSDKVHLYMPKSDKKRLITIPLPYSFEVYTSIVGDKADNVKAVRGFEEQEITDMATSCKTIDDVLLKAKAGDASWSERVLKSKKQLQTNSRLVRLYRIKELEGDIHLERAGVIGTNIKKMYDILSLYEFKNPDQYLWCRS